MPQLRPSCRNVATFVSIGSLLGDACGISFLPFLYETRTIQRRAFRSASSPADPSSYGFYRPLKQNTSRDRIQEPTKSRDRERRPQILGTDVSQNDKSRDSVARYNVPPREEISRPSWGLYNSTRRRDDGPVKDELSAGVRESTMTTTEKAAFSRLFDSLVDRKATAAETEDQGEKDLALEYLDDSELDDSLDSFDVNKILSDEAGDDSPSIERYPRVIQRMAAQAQREFARNERGKKTKEQASQETEKAVLAESRRKADEARIQGIVARLKGAETDFEIWEALEDDLFSKIRVLDLDAQDEARPQEKKGKKQKSDKTKLNPEGVKAAIIGQLSHAYPALMVFALRLLMRHTPHSALISSLLPTMKSLGPSAYAWGISTKLFNYLLLHHWRVENDYRTLLRLLKEMDAAGLNMSSQTRMALDIPTKYRERALEGRFGVGVQALEGMSERMREGAELDEWQARIRAGLEQAHLERMRRADVEKSLRDEGVFAEDDPVADQLPAPAAAAAA